MRSYVSPALPQTPARRDADAVVGDLIGILQAILAHKEPKPILRQNQPRIAPPGLSLQLPDQPHGTGFDKAKVAPQHVPRVACVAPGPPAGNDVPLPSKAGAWIGSHAVPTLAVARAPPSPVPALEEVDMPWDSNVTTLQVMNLPTRCTLEHLLEVWTYDGTYNYVHLPYSKKHRRTVSYAFLNFMSTQAARDFHDKWQGARLPIADLPEPRQTLRVQPATVQGLEENILTFAQSPHATNARHAPAVFSGAHRLDIQNVLQVTLRHACSRAAHTPLPDQMPARDQIQ